jgi:D-threo-aldose 1-dehydrogenase
VWVGLEHDAVQDISYHGILRCWEEGNRFLGDYDARLLSVHDPDEYLAAAKDASDREARWGDILQAYRALEELRTSGKADAIGVGVKDWRVGQKLVDICDLDWVMIAACFTIYRHEPELTEFIETLRKRGISVINSAVFHGGFLTGGQFFDYRLVDTESGGDADLFRWRDQFYAVCEQFNVTPAEACVAFGVSPPGVVSIALNTSRPKYMAINARLPLAQPDDEFWKAMKRQKLIRADYPYLGVEA